MGKRPGSDELARSCATTDLSVCIPVMLVVGWSFEEKLAAMRPSFLLHHATVRFSRAAGGAKYAGAGAPPVARRMPKRWQGGAEATE